MLHSPFSKGQEGPKSLGSEEIRIPIHLWKYLEQLLDSISLSSVKIWGYWASSLFPSLTSLWNFDPTVPGVYYNSPLGFPLVRQTQMPLLDRFFSPLQPETFSESLVSVKGTAILPGIKAHSFVKLFDSETSLLLLYVFPISYRGCSLYSNVLLIYTTLSIFTL